MHSWLIRSPEPSAPQQWTIRHVEREPVSDEPLSEITDMKRRPGRVISLPRRCEGEDSLLFPPLQMSMVAVPVKKDANIAIQASLCYPSFSSFSGLHKIVPRSFL